MYSNNLNGVDFNSRNKRENNENITLPKLSPLYTKSSFNENSHGNIQNSIPGSYPVIQQLTPSRRANETGSPFNSPSSNKGQSPQWMTPARTPTRHRRPPPPLLPTFSPPTSPHTDDKYSSHIRNHSQTTSFHASPFNRYPPKNEMDSILQQNSDSINNKVYKSPFVGDLQSEFDVSTSSDPLRIRSNKLTNSEIKPDNSKYQKIPPIDTSAANISSNKYKMQGSEELRNISSNSNRSRTITPINSGIGFYNKPPLPSSNSRNVSSISRSSDGIESYYSDSNYTFNNSGARHSSFNSILGGKPLELIPSITTPTQPFSIDLLDENKLYQCYSVYRLSDIYEWILKIYFEWFNEYVFGKIEFYQVVQRLLEFQMPNTFDQDIIDSNVDKIIGSFLLQNAVRFERRAISSPVDQGQLHEVIGSLDSDVTIILGGLDIQGIFTELLPCYSFADTTYDQVCPSLCYSYTCMNHHSKDKRKEIKIADIIKKPVGLWTDYWHITPEELSEINPREVQRQSFIFDLIILEERSLNMANAAVEIYGNRFDPALLPNEPNFAELAFEVFKPLIDLHKDYLLEPIFHKLEIKGKFIDSIGKIYLKWCNEAREPYLRYAVSMATVHEIIRWEKNHQTNFSSWLDEVDHSPEITRSKMYYDVIFFGGYFKSLQNMTVTLNSILKVTDPSLEDHDYLKMVIRDIEKLSSEVDKVHGDAIDRRKLTRFSSQLLLHNSSKSNTVAYANLGNPSEIGSASIDVTQDRLDLGLDDPDRRLILSGNVEKKRELWLDPIPVFLVLLDNYLLIMETAIKNKSKMYKLIERPVPVDYLNLEKKIKDEDYQSMFSYSNRDSREFINTTPSTPINSARPTLLSAASNRSKSIIASNDREIRTGISNAQPSESQLSFKIRNTATNESFSFITSNLNEKYLWIKSIIDRLKGDRRNTNRNILDFEVVSTQFAYSEKDAPVNLPVAPDGSEIDSALKVYETKNQGNIHLENFPMVTNILCTEKFEYEGKSFLLIATTNGILVRLESDKDTKFVKVIQCGSVRKIEINQKLGLLFVLDDRNLCYFNIPSIFGAYYDRRKYLSNNLIIGIVLRDKVGYFNLAEDFGNSKHLLYERKGKIMVLTPEFDHLTKLFKYFKEYKEYKLPTSGLTKLEIQDIVVFKKCFIACTSKGAVLFQDAFNDEGIFLPTFFNDSSISEYTSLSLLNSGMFKPGIEAAAKKDSSKQKMAEYVKRDIAMNKTKPITCFKLNDSNSYILVYDEAVVKLDSNGQIPNWTEDILILDFYCTGACYFKGHLILVGDSLIQIYNLRNQGTNLGKCVPNQIIKGKKVLLVSSSRKDKFNVVLSHPNIASRQLLLTCDLADI